MKRSTLTSFVAVITAATILIGGVPAATARAAGETITYGFVQDPIDPLMITAVAYPNFTSTDTTVSTATFTFLVPAGTVLDPAVPLAPGFGSLIDINGSWVSFYLTPDLWATATGRPAAELEGYDLYQMTLAPATIENPAGGFVAGEAFPLFRFRIPFGCTKLDIRMLNNGEPIRNNLLDGAGFNVNNHFSATVDNQPSHSIYSGNEPSSASLTCEPAPSNRQPEPQGAHGAAVVESIGLRHRIEHPWDAAGDRPRRVRAAWNESARR